MNKSILALLLAVIVAACGAGSVRVVIPPGTTFRAAADSLARAKVVGSARLFRVYASISGHDRRIHAGTYLMSRGMSWGAVLDALTRGTGMIHTVTIPEGYAISDIAPLLARTLGVEEDSVLAAARDSTLRERLDVPTPTLEGYLFPDTYSFSDGTSARSAVQTMVRRFEQVWDPAWNERLQAMAMTRHDIVTLASIVEKEAKLPEERPVIAAVYLNRLKAKMLLQADPTVQYALGKHVTRVLYKDLEIESPYNTYKHLGLPPGPIASPGRPSIVAALNPANVPYRYFVAYPDGHHEFTTDFARHSIAVRNARREWDSVAALRRDTMRPAEVAPSAPMRR